jgi:hypothetical protein
MTTSASPSGVLLQKGIATLGADGSIVVSGVEIPQSAVIMATQYDTDTPDTPTPVQVRDIVYSSASDPATLGQFTLQGPAVAASEGDQVAWVIIP